MPAEAGAAEGHQHYDNCPIVEASISISVGQIPVERYGLLGTLGAGLGDTYVKIQTLAEFAAAKEQPTASGTGIVYTTADELNVVQARSDGFTFAREAPYESWEPFLDETRRCWGVYKDVVTPPEPHDLTVKYVNLIRFPLGVPLRDLFSTYPMLPDEGQLLDDLTMHYRYTPSGRKRGRASISVLMVYTGLADEHVGAMVLDNTFSFRFDSEQEIWEAMPEIRNLKNATFESQVRESLKETFYARG